MSERSKKIIAVVAAILIVAAAISATICMVKHKKAEPVETTTEPTTMATTTKSIYTVDLEYIQRMLDKQVFTDKFKEYSAETYATPNEASKEAYWEGIQQGKTVNPLLLAATSSYLSELGFDAPSVKPSELYDEPENNSNIAKLNAKGEQTLNSVKKIIFSDEVKIRTDNLGSSAKGYYNSAPSKEDGIVYASRIGITGNTACWIITIQKDVDIDDAYVDVLEANKASSSGKKSTEATTVKTETKQVIQLCRCGNTVDKKPKKPEPTTKQPTTKQPTTKQPTTKQPTTKPTTKAYTKNQQKDPVNQGNADRGGGSKRSEEDKTATTRYQAEEPTMPSSVRKVTTTKASTTKASTTTKVPSTTKAPTTTRPTTTAPKAEPTHVESNTYVDKGTGKTTVVSDDTVVTGAITRPKR